MTVPNDPFMLLSYVNTQLRDKYPSFDAMCGDMELDGTEIKQKLEAAGFSYDEKLNKFC